MSSTENFYRNYFETDYSHCVPIATKQQLGQIFSQVPAYFGENDPLEGDEYKASVALDLELLQVANYTQFEDLNTEQRDFIAAKNISDPIDPEDITFLALSSLATFFWPEPKFQEELLKAATCDALLLKAMRNSSQEISQNLKFENSKHPYWARLSFLNVLSRLPPNTVSSASFPSVGITVLKRTGLNATTFSLSGSSVIGLNYALQPLLKLLNRFLLEYFSTQHLAGPKRYTRAWGEIVPIVLYFWNALRPYASSAVRPPMMIGMENVQKAQHLTVDQVDFIVGHEFGHAVLNHPKRLAEFQKNNESQLGSIRHEFEFAADQFSLELFRSNLINNMRNPGYFNEAEVENEKFSPIASYYEKIEAMNLLFLYMDFIQKAGSIIKERTADDFISRAEVDTHPVAADRLERVQACIFGDYPQTTPLIRFATDFLRKLCEHAERLTHSELVHSIEGAKNHV